jgi:hypothetical protein
MTAQLERNMYYFHPAVSYTALTHTATEDVLSSHFPGQNTNREVLSVSTVQALQLFKEIIKMRHPNNSYANISFSVYTIMKWVTFRTEENKLIIFR